MDHKLAKENYERNILFFFTYFLLIFHKGHRKLCGRYLLLKLYECIIERIIELKT